MSLGRSRSHPRPLLPLCPLISTKNRLQTDISDPQRWRSPFRPLNYRPRRVFPKGNRHHSTSILHHPLSNAQFVALSLAVRGYISCKEERKCWFLLQQR